MNDKVRKTLEFDKVLSRLAAYTENERVGARIATLVPRTDIHEVRALLEETTEAVGFLMRQGNPPSLKVADLAPALKRLDRGGILSMQELLAVSGLLKVARRLKRYVEDDKQAEGGILAGLAAGIVPIREVEVRIDEAILSEDEMADNASPELANIRRRMRALSGRIRETLNGIISSPHYQKCLQEPIITMRGDRYVVPVKAEHKGVLKGIVHDTSASGSTLFVEPMPVVTMAGELTGLAGQEQDEIGRILAELSAYVGEFAGEISQNLDTVYELDFIFCKGKLSVEQNAMAPTLNEENVIDIRQGRHPLLDPQKVVPIDVRLGGDFDTLVITGPNTGGKTVTLKTLGLFALMTQAGLHIPVRDHTRMGIFSEIFADIGDEQSIEQSLSTFSSHMVNLVDILNQVDDRSLVLADELGAGTDPVEGAALAIAILEYIRGFGARAAATTHYSELKTYALTTPGVENASCEFDVQTLSPTYRLLIGVPGKSNAFAISKRLGLSDSVIARAKELLREDSVKMEDVINRLEENRRQAEADRRRTETLERDARILKARLEEEEAALAEKKRQILADARQEALRILDDAKEDAQAALRDIRTVRDTALELDARQEAERAKNRIKERTDKIAAAAAESGKPVRRVKPPKDLKPGNTVEILSLSQKATVLTAPDKDGNFQAQAGIMKVKVNVRDVRRVEEAPKFEKPQPRKGGVGNRSTSPGMELDIRGRYPEEALSEVDKFLDNAVLSGLHSVTIIHGKGTGVLRKAVQAHLRGHKHVAEFRLGRFGEGEDGVTLVELR